MDRLIVRSYLDGAELVLAPVVEWHDGSYHATLKSPVLTAELRINELESASLVAYFKDLSSTWWAGWEGEKTYRSLEGQLSLATSHHVRGHIGLKVCLRGYIGETAWEASGALDLEGSQLDQLAHDASLVFLREKAG